jgi:hypothetical protein
MEHARVRSVAVKLGFGVLAAAFLVTPLAAQVSVGLKGGVSHANLGGRDAQSTNAVRGVGGGAFITYALVDELSAQVEALYVQKGARLDIASPGGVNRDVLRLDYIEVPIMLRLDAMPLRGLAVHALAGPSMAIRVRCRLNEHRYPRSAGYAAIRTFDWNMVGGGGFTLGLGRVGLLLEGRYHVGLGTINEPAANLERTNLAFTILAGAVLPLR